MAMSLDDAATLAVGSPTITPPTTKPSSVDDAAALALHQTDAATVATVKNNIYNAAATNPDTAAANQSLAKQIGAPVESVAANPVPAQQQVAAQNVNVSDLIKNAPATTSFLTNPQNAAIAHDDVQNLAAIEKTMYVPPTSILDKLGSYFGAVSDSVAASNARLAGTIIAPFLSDANQQTLMQKGIITPPGGTPLPAGASLATKILHGLAGGFGSDSPLGIALGVHPGFQAVSAPLSPAFDYGQQKIQQGAKKLGLPDVDASAVPDALGIFMNLLGAKGIEHFSATPLEKANAPTPEMNAVAEAIVPHIDNAVKAMNADANANRMAQVNALATDSKVRARAPEAFQAFMNDASQNAPIQDLYIDAKTFAQAAGDNLPAITKAIPSIADQLPTALTAATDIRIPVADFATHLAGSEMAEALIPHLKTDPEAFSQVEAQEYLKTMTPQIEADVQKALKMKEEKAATQASSDAVHDQLLTQLTDTKRFTPDVNKPYAQLLSSFYDTMSKRAGSTPEKMLEQFPVKIKAESAGGGFDQTKEGTLYHGTSEDFEGQIKPSENGVYGPGVYLSHDYDTAAAYGGEGSTVKTYNVKGNFATDDDLSTALEEAKAQGFTRAAKAKRANEILAEKGFDGIHDDKVVNVFDPKNIIEGPQTDLLGTREFAQDKLGAFNPKTLTISVMKGANLSTFLHESGHFFLHAITEMASALDAPEGIKADAQTLMDWLGVKDASAWKDMSVDEQRDAHEKFARSFEKYLLDGQAPSLELQPIFARFRSWLLSVYKSVSDFLVGHPEAGHISPEVRGVFDRMLATDEQIGKAEAARGMSPLFTTPEAAGMKPEEFAAYTDQAQAATDTATRDLDSRRIKDMQYASNARSEAIKELQRTAATLRGRIREEVTKEVQKEPVYQAEQYIRNGKTFDGETALGDVKMNREALKQLDIPSGDITALNHARMTSTEGLHPDALAELFNFSSGKEMVDALLHSEPMAEKIRGLTDQRMLERHGDLTDPQSIARAADAAIHNDVRTKLISTELNALNKQLGNKSLLTKVAKEFAAKVVARLPANKINPNLYIAAAAKAGKLADAAFKAGDIKEAAEQKKNQLINQYAVKAAFEQKALVDKGLTFLKRFGNNSYREKIPGKYLEQIDGLLSKYDLRKNPSDAPTRAEKNLTAWVTSQREAGFEPYVPDFILTGNTMHYGDMTVEQFRGLVDTVRSIKHMADNLKEVTIAGQKMAVEQAVGELLKPLEERGTKFSKEDLLNPPEVHTDSFFAVALHKIGTTLRLINADLKPQEFKRNSYDLHQLEGPFGKLLFEPMFERNYWKVQQLKEISTKFGEYGEKLGKEWQKSLYDLVPNKTLLDPDLSTETEPVPMKITRAKLLGIARHVGNESNFDKLTKGYNWKPGDVWNFLHDNMTEKDWQATQAQWGIFEKYWPEIEALSRRLGGVPPEKIPLRPFETKFGRVEGGYAPIDYDPIRSKLSAKFGDIMAEPHEQIGQEPAYKATTTFNGSMQNRSAGYTDRVNLDYHGVESRLRDTIHDLAYREALIDANKLITDPKFRSQFMGTFGREEYRGLQTWLRGIRDMNRDESQIKGFEKFLQYARTGVVMTGIAYRLSTVLKHGSSAALKSLGYLGDGSGAKYFASRAARMATGNAQADIAGAMEKFPEIASRMNQMDRDYKVGTKSMYHAEDWRAKNDRFGHAMVAWSDMLTAVPTAWAAYDRATIEGIPESLGGTGKPMTEKQAVAYANKVVREAHGTALEANRSLFLQARGVKGLFGTIYGFMNNTYGQLGDLMDKTVVGGHFQNKPVLVARAMATIVAPAMMAAWVSGQFNDKDPWYKQAGKAILGEVAGTVPFVRDAWSMIERGDTSSAGESAPLRLVGDAVKVALDAYKGAHGKSSKWIQDTANAIGELFHIGGLGQAGKSLQYLKDVHDGKQNPKGAHEFITGVTIGAHPKE